MDTQDRTGTDPGSPGTGPDTPGTSVVGRLTAPWRSRDGARGGSRGAELAARARPAVVAALRGLVLAVCSLAGSLALLVLSVVSIVLIPVAGIGLLTTPAVLGLVRLHANQRRLLAVQWSGVRIPVPYRPLPDRIRGGYAGRGLRMLADPATWRDLAWLVTDMTGGALLALLAMALVEQGLFGILLALGLWIPVVRAADGWWFAFIPITGWGTAALAGLLGCCFLALSPFASPLLVEGHFRLGRLLLDRDREAELSRRIDRLTATRHDAVDTAAAELRRIERDLHDGAQARLVAMGMDLGTVEALIEKDPARARALLWQARKSSAEALTELRDLVRGIHPPVLAERGLGDAVRALALRLPVPVDVDIQLEALPARPSEPLEAAAYFAVSEVLTNAVKHARAERIRVDIHHAGGALRISVTDDGVGGAVIGAGSGLSGVERRLGTFDGILAVSSPAGGPTMVTMEIPCALS
ncbi:sensor histidine kinase [Streptomyces sp. TS71-3]|uniref:sensor histidine kinase n=1 Tax=Streptomyces sp. TS71-3 TaxID=2733862 RepID=UPI001B28B593|nr:sensor histidine kinase [Streptomyces sp. TS71-3]GHJ38089.1 histidine kinase [Streptomyces sp. TS71-3]